MSDNEAPIKRKLIEVALPLEAINRESAREKSIRHGHPSTLHLWWSRKPLATARSVIFAQLVDDPSADKNKFPTEEAQANERRRLFEIIEKLAVWENSNDESLLRRAYEEIAKCYDGKPPGILDPFAGGGSIPLEAQRLKLDARASDLNPVAVIINKALSQIPSTWAGQPPVFPGAAESRIAGWPGATGLAEDVRRYGNWMRNEANRRIGTHYPKAKLADGSEASVISWIWVRTVTCPNPACNIRMPLYNKRWLGKKRGKEAYIVPVVGDGRVEFSIGHEIETAPTKGTDGTVTRTGATCVACGTAVPLNYLRAEGKAKRMGVQLAAVAAEGHRRRLYLAPTPEQENAAAVSAPEDVPDTELPEAALGFRVQGYGMTKHADLFTPRQLIALTTFSDLVKDARAQVLADAISAGIADEGAGNATGLTASEYADAIATYLSLSVSRQADYLSSLCVWAADPKNEGVMHVFGRQAIPMVWDFAEVNPFSESSGNWDFMVRGVTRVLDRIKVGSPTDVRQGDAAECENGEMFAISTDPPYYDYVGYADLSDFFYVWLRRGLTGIYPSLLGTLLTPKSNELVADPFRRGGEKEAERYFEDGYVDFFKHIRLNARRDTPITVYYAFKQAESETEGLSSTGWEVLLEGIIRSGWEITATWPIRTERSGRMRDNGSNALASSIVLACRPRIEGAPTTSRRAFLAECRAELPRALKELQQGSIAPVDLAQAAIGPGMSVFSRYAKVIEPDGKAMKVRAALAEINRALDEVLSEQEGDFDSDTRFCVKWFSQYGWDEISSGTADTLSRAVNTSVDSLVRGGVFWQRAGKARLIEPDDLSSAWDPTTDDRISVWEVVLRIAKALSEKGADEAARLMAAAGGRIDLEAAKELAYLLFSICEKRKWARTALLFNGLGTSWSDLSAVARAGGPRTQAPSQGELDFASIEE